MLSKADLGDMIDFVRPLPGHRKKAREELMRQVEVMQEAEKPVADDRASIMSRSEYRKAWKKLSITLAKAAEQARLLGSRVNPQAEFLRFKLKSEDQEMPASMTSYLDICAQTANDLAEHLVVPKGAPLPDGRKTLAVSAAYSILTNLSTKQISSTEGGGLCLLAEALFQHAFKEEATGKLEHYLKNEVRFRKDWAKKTGK